MKVLHLPTSVGGHGYGLSRAERELGLSSDVLYTTNNYFNFPADIVLCRNNFKPLTLLAAVCASWRYPKHYDILHFNFGSTLVDGCRGLINNWDLLLYKKQKLFVTYNGSDARLSFETMYPDGEKHPDYAGIDDPLYANPVQENRIKKRIAQFEKAGAHFFARNPDLIRCLPKGAQFLPYIIYGLNTIDTLPYKPSNTKLRVIHAPTNRLIKGTAQIIKAVDALEKKYPGKIELQLVEGVDNQTARNIYLNADIIVDQLRVGWYGGFALECMKIGKPVIVYLNHDDLRYVPEQMAKDCREAVLEADCDTIEQTLEECIHDKNLLQRKAVAAIEYVQVWHNPIEIAKQVVAQYKEALS